MLVHMDITPYIDSLRRDLVAASEAGGDEIRQAAERLALALDPSARLALMEAISHAAAEITSEMPAGSVDVRLNGRELDFVVQGAAPLPPAPPAAPTPPTPEELDEGGLSRVTLRIPESVKSKAEDKAARAGQSLNTWLVNVVRAATSDSAINVDIDLSSIPFLEGFGPFGKQKGNKRMTGWV
ncbi:MAG: pilus assembly protein HicB [Nocardioidaceae bacterium]